MDLIPCRQGEYWFSYLCFCVEWFLCCASSCLAVLYCFLVRRQVLRVSVCLVLCIVILLQGVLLVGTCLQDRVDAAGGKSLLIIYLFIVLLVLLYLLYFSCGCLPPCRLPVPA